MKIGIDASRYSHDKATGVEWYSYHIINGLIELSLKKDDTEVLLYSPNDFEIPKEFEHPGKIRKVIIPFKRLWTLYRLSKEMKKNPPDVLFVPSHTLPLIRPAFSVITIHDVAFRYLKKSYSRFQYWYLNWSTKYAVKNATKIIVPSEATKQDLVNHFRCSADKIVVIPHGFKADKHIDADKVSENLKYFGFGKENDVKNPYVLFVGRLESKKNLVRLVEAFDIFSKEHPDWRLVLAGKRGVGFDRIMDIVSKLKISEKVIMPGYVNEDEKAYLFKNCSIFAFPSLYEGFGFPILEAFNYLKPVLASHVSSIPEVAGEAAIYCDPFDVQDMALSLERFVDDPNFALSLIEKGKERVLKFTWSEASKKTFDVLTK